MIKKNTLWAIAVLAICVMVSGCDPDPGYGNYKSKDGDSGSRRGSSDGHSHGH